MNSFLGGQLTMSGGRDDGHSHVAALLQSGFSTLMKSILCRSQLTTVIVGSALDEAGVEAS
jgi:hypothetical protein